MAKITFKDYTALQNVEGGKTWGDIKSEGYQTSLKNADFFNNLVASPDSITGENITYEFGAYTSNGIFDNSELSADDPILSKQVYQMPANYLEFKYNIKNWGTREAVEWGKWLGETESKINDQMLNINQLTIYQAVIDYCYATGAIRVIDKLTSNTASKEEKLGDVKNICSMNDALMSTQTKYNLGQDASRMINLLSPKAYREACFSFGTFNGSDNAFDANKLGEFTMFQGYKFKKCIQLGQAFNNVKSYENTGYDFSKVIGMTYSLDSLGVYAFEPIWDQVPNGLQSYTRSVIWKMLAVVKPSREALNVIYVSEAPTSESDVINPTRAKLNKNQPQAYSKLPGGAAIQMTNTEFNALKADFKNFDKTPAINLNAPAVAAASEQSGKK